VYTNVPVSRSTLVVACSTSPHISYFKVSKREWQDLSITLVNSPGKMDWNSTIPFRSEI
jgi:hypothetical protein